MQSLEVVTVQQLKEELTAVEIAALPPISTGDKSGSEADNAWLQAKLLQACDRVVAAVNSCDRNPAIKPGLCKVPAGCVRTALVLARHAVISALPAVSDILEGSSRAAEYQTATRELSELASCTLRPEYVLTEDEALQGSGSITLLGKPADSFIW